MMPAAPSSIALRADCVAVELEIGVDRGRALPEARGDQLDFIGMGDELCHNFFALPEAVLPCLASCLSTSARYIVEYLVHPLRGKVFVEVVIDLHRRRPTAGADALDLFERKEPIGRGLLVADAQAALAVVEQLIAPAQHAADVGADLDMIFAVRLGMEQRVVTDDAAHLELGDADAGRDFGDDGGRKQPTSSCA